MKLTFCLECRRIIIVLAPSNPLLNCTSSSTPSFSSPPPSFSSPPPSTTTCLLRSRAQVLGQVLSLLEEEMGWWPSVPPFFLLVQQSWVLKVREKYTFFFHYNKSLHWLRPKAYVSYILALISGNLFFKLRISGVLRLNFLDFLIISQKYKNLTINL